MNQRLTEFTSESVTEGHPDKICDQISDAILDAYLSLDPYSHVACETMATGNKIILAGEFLSEANIYFYEIEEIVRNVIKQIGYTSKELYSYDYKDIEIIPFFNKQSEEINKGVSKEDRIGAGDQGIMFGYATSETDEFMPLPITLAHKLTRALSEARKNNILKYLGPDGKAQVTIKYENGKPLYASSVVIAAQHTEEVVDRKTDTMSEEAKDEIIRKIVMPIISDFLTSDTQIYINNTGKFTIGGPQSDTGLTGRKIMVDTYGGWVPHGGGAFSGKDPTKVDRSAAYMARYVAKNIVKAGIAKKCLIQIAYCIAKEDPVSITVDTFGTGIIDNEKLLKLIKYTFSFKVKDIIEKLKLRRPIYKKTASYGHFGRTDEDFTWEKTDSVELLLENIKKLKL
ncbi:MAG: methionine adenosyltransferase [Elusimicrobiota bacterium]|nr:methionine adenosyltransferase [Elusimicrobiota bacterium]